MRKQYHSRTVGTDRHIWDVHRLVRLSKSIDPFSFPLDQLSELDENWWYQEPQMTPTPRSFADHMILVQQADLAHPILLCSEYRLMDGMHRAVKALTEGRSHIQAIRFPVTPAPDHVNVALHDLPYPHEDI